MTGPAGFAPDDPYEGDKGIRLLALIITTFTLHLNPIVHHHHHPVHRDRAQPVITKFDLCVANRENGEPGATTFNSIHWHAVNGYYGAYSFLHETWEAAGGLRFSYNADTASPRQQTIIFHYWVRRDPGAWPNTVPPCEQYRR